MKLPPYVTHVAAGAIMIANLDRATAKRLQQAGLDVKRGWLTGDGRLAVEPPDESGRHSVDEEDKLMALARHGVAFGYDYKQGMDPVGMMLDLCQRGRYVGSFQQVSFGDDGPQVVRMPEGEETWRRNSTRE